MTNEEKARELIRESYDTEDALIQIAEWKDDYYKKLLDLLVKSGANADIITDYIENCIQL